MTPELLNSLIIQPVLRQLDWPQPRERAVLLTAIAVQESGLKYRRQMPSGPARSWWQIEPKTGMDCLERCVPVRELLFGLHADTIRITLEHSDLGACAIAAGILRLHPGKLPEVGRPWQTAASRHYPAWQYYLAAWRPGKPRPDSWPKAYAEALRVAA